MKNRHFLSFFLALLLSLSLTAVFATRAEAAQTYSGTCGDNLTWTLENGKLTISGTGKMKQFYDGNAPWNAHLADITSVVIKKGVTSIGCYAFSECPALARVTIPEGVTYIGYNAFYRCVNLTSVTIPDGVTQIDYQAFSGCTNLTSVSIPSSLTRLGSGAFYQCSNLVSVTIPKGVTAIESGTFYECSDLASVHIPEGVEIIDSYAFCRCPSLEEITIPDTVTSIGYGAFYACGSLSQIVIPDSVTAIGQWAFSKCNNVTSITLSAGITTIEEHTFYSCPSLKSIIIPSGVTSIGEEAFADCVRLEEVTIPSSVYSIGDYAFCMFWGRSSLTDVYYAGNSTKWNAISIGTGNNNLTTATIHYNFTPLVISKQPAAQKAAEGKTAIFTVKATGNGLKYQWQYRTDTSGSWKDSGAASATTATFSVKGTTARNGYQYRCKITDDAGNTVYTDVVTLTVTGVTITTQPKTQNVKADATAKFTVKATGNGLKYQWQYRTSSSGSWKNSGATSATTATFSVKGTTARNGYQYRCKVTDSAGNSVYSNTVTLYVLGITTQPKTTTVANNATAKFTVKATGNGLKYQWQYRTSSSGNWKNSGATSATTASFSVKGTTARNGYQYRCKITDSAGNTIYSSTVTLKVSAASITTQPKSVTVANGKTANFTVKTSGSGLSYQWQYRTSSTGSWKDSGATSATTAAFSVKGTAARNGYQYRCKITDSNGIVIYTNTVTLTVN